MVAVRRTTAKFKLVVLLLVFVVCACFIHLKSQESTHQVSLDFYRENHLLLDSLNVTTCRLPKYDMYDPQIRKYIDKPVTVIDCGYPQPYLTYMDWDGMLYINETELEINHYSGLKCEYNVITRDESNDYKVLYSESRKIDKFPIFIEEPVIRVNCFDYSLKIYKMVHSQIKPLPDNVIEKNKALPPVYPSVLIFTIDSMSRGNFIRCLSQTYEYLVNKHKMHVFKGLNKVADNTYPNMMALLAGFMAYPRKEMSHMPTWSIGRNSTMKKFDDMPIIWKTLKDLGYVTFYAEEYLDAIFSLLEPGFLNDPVHYYYRSTYVSLKDTLSNIENNKLKFWDRSKWRYCLANEPSYKYMLNYTEEFLTEMANLRYFALSFFVEMSHEYLNDIKNMDLNLLRFFERMFDNHLFDNTILIVMGDHGHRFDDIRSTFIGRIEERMPFLGILLPHSLQKSHPHLQSALASHSETLLSWYDIHEMLVDISLNDLGEQATNIRPKAIGKSIFRPFNDSRTCTEIGILPEYCMCDREAEISQTSEKAITSSKIIMDSINKLLLDSNKYLKKGESRKCATLTLSKISSATISMKSFSSGSSTLVVRVILEVLPSKGLFEAAVEYAPNVDPHLLGDINRINKYGEQPSCISHDILRLYCYCI